MRERVLLLRLLGREVLHFREIGAGDERLVARAGHDHRTQLLILRQLLERGDERAFPGHDVIRVRHGEKALEAGVDGLILVCAGAGGHAGRINPFALVKEVRGMFDGPLVLAGAITEGAGVLAAQAMGCDAAYMGTRFIATRESLAADAYKQMIVDSNAEDIVYTPFFSGVHGSYLKASIRNAGLDPDNLPLPSSEEKLTYRSRDERPKTWKDIWGAGQGVGNIESVLPAAELIERIAAEYAAAKQRLTG